MPTSPQIFKNSVSPQIFSKPKPAPVLTPAPMSNAMSVAPIGVRAASPSANLSKPTSTLKPAEKAPLASQPIATPSVDSNYQIRPQESTEQYNARVANYNTTKNGAPQTQTAPVGANTGTQAPSYPGLMGQQILKAQQTPTFSGLVGNLANQQGSPYNQNAAAAISGLQGTAQTNPGTSGRAYEDYQRKVDEQQRLKSGIAGQYGAIESQAIPLEFQQGREQALSRQYASQLDAAQQAVNQAQQGIGYQLTGAGLQQSGLNQAGSLALTGQGQQQSALNAAAGYAQPNLGSIGQVPFSPLNQEQGSVLGSTQAGGLNAAGNLLGQFAGAQAAGAAPGQAQASNIQTTGTYGTNLAAQGGSAATQDYNTMNALYGAADTQAKTLQGILESTGINANNSTDYNKAINSLSGRLGSANYSQFSTALAELQTMYHNLLSAGGGTPSGNEAQSLALLSPTASANQINGAIYQLQTAANTKLQAQQGLANLYNSQLGAGGGSTGNGGNNDPLGIR